MSTTEQKKENLIQTRIGEYAATQPLSGVKQVTVSVVVNGVGHGGYVRLHEEKTAA